MAEGKQGTQDKAGKKPRLSSAKKRHLQSKKRQSRNRAFKSSVSTAINNYKEIAAKGSPEEAKKSLNSVYSLIDKGVKTGRFKLNKAARTKSRLTKKKA